MAKATTCSRPGCDHEIDRDWYACRPCAVAHIREIPPYLDPCLEYVRGPYWPLMKTCSECGFDSARHPGKGTIATMVWVR